MVEAIIRPATAADIPAIVDLGVQMQQEYGLEINYHAVKTMAWKLYGEHMLHVVDTGTVSGYVGGIGTVQWWNPEHTQFIVISLYVDKDTRDLKTFGTLIRHLETVCADEDCAEVVFGLGAVPQGSREADLMVKLFKRYGYHLGEPVLRKEL